MGGEQEPQKNINEDPSPEDIGKIVAVAEAASRTIGPWTECPRCEAPPQRQSVRNYDPTWMDGDVHCDDCNAYVRMWDAG